MEENNLKTTVVGVDISIETTTYAMVDVRGNILAEDAFPTLDYPDVNNFVTALSEKIVMMVEQENAANLPWKGIVPLAAMLRDRIGLAVGLSNDAHISALGEYTFGSAHGMTNFIIVSLGVGIGSCFFSDSKEHRGHGGYAGEFGHTCVYPEGRQCGCGNKGCLEAYVGAKGIVKTAQKLMAESDAPSLMRDLEKLSPRTIKECCDKGDEMAIDVYRRTGRILGQGLATYASLIDPEAIIFTGGVSHAGHWLLDPAKEVLDQLVFGNLKNKVKLIVSRLDDRERDVLGASALAWSVPEYSLFK